MWDVGPEYRGVSPQLGVLARVVGLLYDGLGIFLQLLRPQVAAVFDHDHVSAGPADPANRRRAENGDLGVGDHAGNLSPQLVGNVFVISFRRRSLIEWPERQEHRAEIRSVSIHEQRLPGHPHGRVNALDVVSNLFHLHDHVLRALSDAESGSWMLTSR